MFTDLNQGHHNRIRLCLVPGIVELPPVIVGVVEDVSNRVATTKDMMRGEHRAIRRLVERPRVRPVGSTRVHASARLPNVDADQRWRRSRHPFASAWGAHLV